LSAGMIPSFLDDVIPSPRKNDRLSI